MSEREMPKSLEIVAPQFNTVIALGKNWKLPIKGDIHLSIESKLTALAAGHMYAEGKAGRVIFSTGQTAGTNTETGLPYPNEADEMKKFLRIFFKEDVIPDEAITTENTSFDTAGNAQEAVKILGDKYGEIALLTVGYHLPRSRELFKNYGIQSTGFKSEDIVENTRNSRYADYYREYARKKLFRIHKPSVKPLLTKTNIHAKELVARSLVYTVDPKGTGITRKITAKSRHRE